MSVEVVAEGFGFPEGPVAMPDGTVIVVEAFGSKPGVGNLTRVREDGSTELIAEIVGGPNGAALGPDGHMYVCNNGGCFTDRTIDGVRFPGPPDYDIYRGGSITRVDLATGAYEDIYTHVDGVGLHTPNDLMFDEHGGFYFTDHGIHEGRTEHIGAIYYALADGSKIVEVEYPAASPNGIGISPDGSKLYWAETHTGRVQVRDIVEPGRVAPVNILNGEGLLYGFDGMKLLDSLGMDGAGNVCVATMIEVSGISVISPAGELIEFVATEDPLTTNICFGGPDLRTAWITESGYGRLLKTEWPRPGLALPHLNK